MKTKIQELKQKFNIELVDVRDTKTLEGKDIWNARDSYQSMVRS